MFEVERQSEEIYDLMNWAQEGVDQGTRYSGMSYELWLDYAAITFASAKEKAATPISSKKEKQ